MRILFSIYTEDLEQKKINFIESIWVQTDWRPKQIDDYIAIYDGFRAEIAIGERISFFDYYCYSADYDVLIQKIKALPNINHQVSRVRTPVVFRVSKLDPGNANNPKYPNDERCFLYELKRYECGASGFAAITYWAATHPLEMVFIGGLLYDLLKWVFFKVLNCLGIKKDSNIVRPMFLNTNRLYRNFSKVTNIAVKDCQIIKINRLRAGVFHVKIRTTADESYKIKCKATGTIETLELIAKTRE